MLGLRTHIVRAENIKEVADWYTQVFEQKPYFESKAYIGFEVGGFEFGVFQIFPWQEISSWKNIHIYWGVEDIESEYQRILELGATSYGEPTNVGGDIVTAEVIDPFGNIFGIIYNPEFKG